VSELVRLGIRVHGEQAETALAALLDLLPGGLEERALGDDVEFATYGQADALPDPAVLRARLGGALAELSRAPVPEDWARRWHAHLGPVTVEEQGRALTIRPPWVPGDPGDLVVDPDVMCGAGTHPTTRLVLRLLLGCEPGGALCDWGAGTGVLAVVAAKLGYAPVTAVDHDPLSVEACRENARANGVELAASALDLRAQEGPWAPVVCANLLRPLLLAVAGVMRRPPELLIASGLLVEECDEVAAAFARHGLSEADRRTSGEWGALALAR
jgi:ribosomal protein L11 methyltransferase